MFRFQNADQRPAESAQDRLDSWKEIAGYLRRDVSTVVRWEKTEGLPVHRHVHARLSSVYAYRSELDAWWGNRESRLVEVPLRLPFRQMPVRPAIALCVLGVTFVLAWWVLHRALWPPEKLDFQERDWVLVADFENRTRKPLLDGTLEYALARELASSRYVNVVPRPRIEDVLQLMRKPPDVRLDEAVAREICLRDGAIRALLTGRIERIDSSYLLSVRLVNPEDGKPVAAHSEEAAEESQLLGATRHLASWVRQTLGEALQLIRESEESLEKVTTPSLRALRIFTQADALERQGKHGPASQLLKSALVEDPEFPAAYTWLAWTIANQGRPREEYLSAAQRGVELMLSGGVSERERYLIQGSYHLLAAMDATSPVRADRLAEALPIWEALVERYPEDFWGNANLTAIYLVSGSPEYFPQFLRLARLRPSDFYHSARAAEIQIRTLGDPIGARPWVLRARELASPREEEQHPQLSRYLEQIQAFERWLEGDLEEVLKLSKGTVEVLRSRATVSEACFVLGRHRDIKNAQVHIDGIRWDWVLAAYDTWADRELDDLHRIYPRDPAGPAAVFALARTGRIAEAEKVVSSLPTTFGEPYVEILRGELARVEGHDVEAVSRLQKGLDRFLETVITGTFFLGAESLAWIHEQRGHLEKAVQVLEQASQTRRRCLPLYAAGFWIRNECLLANLYHRLGQEPQAKRIENKLRGLLAYADQDHPILVRQCQRQEVPAEIE